MFWFTVCRATTRWTLKVLESLLPSKFQCRVKEAKIPEQSEILEELTSSCIFWGKHLQESENGRFLSQFCFHFLASVGESRLDIAVIFLHFQIWSKCQNFKVGQEIGSKWVRQGGESESGQIVLKKVKWTYFDAYLWQTMWNHAKNQWNWKCPNFQIQCFYNGTSGALC